MSTDTIADMLTRLRNACLAKHRLVKVPLTKITLNIADIFLQQGFITSCEYFKIGISQWILIKLKYKERKKGVQALKNTVPIINSIIRVSKPGRRIYCKVKKMPRIQNGFGCAVISTSKGIITDKKARKENIGGEVLCYIW